MPEIRPADTDDEIQAFLDLVAVLYPDRLLTLEEVRAFEASIPDSQHFLAVEDVDVVGAGVARLEPRISDRKGAAGWLLVAPRARGSGVGSALYSAISNWARQRGLEWLEGSVRDNEPESIAWAERRGFAEDRRESGLELDLTTMDPPEVAAPDGIEIVSWSERPELARGLYEVACEAYPDVPGDENDPMEPFEDWLAHDMSGPSDPPEATFVALAGDEVVGYAKFSLPKALPAVAWHDLTGVKRAWRGRGIAGALKRAEIRWAKENGFETLSTMNEQRNAPIRKLNERYGYRPAPGRIFVVGPLAPA
jgi:GNAT superfamily N-acetyltransferase